MNETTITITSRPDGVCVLSVIDAPGSILFSGTVPAWRNLSPGLLQGCVIGLARLLASIENKPPPQ